jgi:hypothetical protein
MAFGPALRIPFAEKAPSDRHEGHHMSLSLAAVAGTTAAGNFVVAPAAKAMNKNPQVQLKPTPFPAKAGKVGFATEGVKARRGGVDWSLFFSSLRAV